MDTPTPAQIRQRSALLTARLPLPDPLPDPLDDPLIPWIEEASALVASLTCRMIGPDSPGEEVPPNKVPLALRAVAMKTEQLYEALGTVQTRRRSMGTGRLRSFAAGNYSESYFGPGDAADAKVLDLDTRLHEILWSLCTDECRDYWLHLWNPDAYPNEPVAGPLSYDWGMRPGGF